ncbi:MAG: gluconokinase [Anaerolineales bacterium]|nr:gluconokinase [Anaerolineales bacterium]
MNATGLIVMGVAGCGKTTVGKALAARLGWDFFDADGFHPPANVAKMAAGIPLDDEDRAPWLAALHELLTRTLQAGRHPVLACSALKQRYRDTLLACNDGIRVVYLRGSYGLILARMNDRTDHYMKPGMLRSQFDALEEPRDALIVDITPTAEEIVENVLFLLHKDDASPAPAGRNGNIKSAVPYRR